MTVKSHPRFRHLAPVYRSFPMEYCRHLAARKSVLVLGAASAALAQSLAAASHVNVLLSSAATPESNDDLQRALANCETADIMIVLDPDWAEAILADANTLFLIRQRTRSTLLLPQECRASGISVFWGRGASACETDGVQHWRWAESSDSRISLTICGSAESQHPLVLSFAVRAAPHATSAILSIVHVTIDGLAVPLSLYVEPDDIIRVPLRQNVSELVISADIEARAVAPDKRLLSFAIFNPEVHAHDGNLISDRLATCSGVLGWPTALRDRLHKAGFYSVAGLISKAEGTGRNRVLPTTFGNPDSITYQKPTQWTPLEESTAYNEILWLVASNAGVMRMPE